MENVRVDFYTGDGFQSESLDFLPIQKEIPIQKYHWEGESLRMSNQSGNGFHQAMSSNSGMVCQRFDITSVYNWPETKVEMKDKSIELPLNGKRRTTIPQFYKRTVKRTVFAQVCYPSKFSSSLKEDIELCAKSAIADSVAVAIASGVTGAYPIFKRAFEKALSEKLPDKKDKVSFALKTEIVSTNWVEL